jgi:hypothetical protein
MICLIDGENATLRLSPAKTRSEISLTAMFSKMLILNDLLSVQYCWPIIGDLYVSDLKKKRRPGIPEVCVPDPGQRLSAPWWRTWLGSFVKNWDLCIVVHRSLAFANELV